MSKKQQVQETIFNGSKYEGDGWPPEDPAGFMAWFQVRIDRIPPKYRATARIELGSQNGYYGESYASLEIVYTREETDGQFAARLQHEESQKQNQVQDEKRLLARLLAKHWRSNV